MAAPMGGPVRRLPRPAGRTPADRGYEKLSRTRGRAVRAFGDRSFLDSVLLTRRRHHAADRRLVLAGPLHRPVVLLLSLTGTPPHSKTAASLSDALRDHTTT
ncbi:MULTISPECIES: hypothetical protein [Streptomyces albovinaceus subgroup]|nr:hypothetical protein [Streptomyces mediolani]WSV94025.1 hypothetical protein OG449_34285 [Streptomyces globisporus]